jgi:hypothetical protein
VPRSPVDASNGVTVAPRVSISTLTRSLLNTPLQGELRLNVHWVVTLEWATVLRVSVTQNSRIPGTSNNCSIYIFQYSTALCGPGRDGQIEISFVSINLRGVCAESGNALVSPLSASESLRYSPSAFRSVSSYLPLSGLGSRCQGRQLGRGQRRGHDSRVGALRCICFTR